jgi:Superfamily I DNA and RNA helicases
MPLILTTCLSSLSRSSTSLRTLHTIQRALSVRHGGRVSGHESTTVPARPASHTTHSNVCVVGDEDQSIYSWRGADIQNILSFEKDYPSVRVIRLEQNYRSTKTILAAASAVVANNEMRKGKSLWTQNPPGERITYMEASDSDEEAMFTAEKILGYQKSRPDARIAVLYRTNFLSRVMEEKLRRYNMKYRIAGGFSFYERARSRT